VDARVALLFLGSGLDTPSLHNPDFDFPDPLIAIGAAILSRIAEVVDSRAAAALRSADSGL